MGWIEEIFADVKVFSDEIQSIKDEFVSSIIDPSGELGATVNEIVGEISGTSSSTSSSTDDTAKTSTSIAVSDGNDTSSTN